MNIDALQVFNALHSLNITEEEFADLEQEQKHTERTGLYIGCIKKGFSICVSHDQNHKIIIKKIKEGIPTPSRVMFKTLITFDGLPEEVYTLHAIAQYRALDTDIKHRAHNLEELKDRVCDRFVDNHPKTLGEYYETNNYYSDMHSYDEDKRTKWVSAKSVLIDKQLKALFWLFGEDYNKFEKIVKAARRNIARIVKVFERNNRRLAIIHRVDDYDKRRGGGSMYSPVWYETVQGSKLMIRCFKPGSKQYDYVDVNREIYLPVEAGEVTEIWLDDDLFEKTRYEELKVLSRRLFADQEDEGKRWLLLNADEFNKKQTLIRIEVMSVTRKAQQQQATNDLVKRIDTQFKKGKVVRQGITFRKNSIECEGIVVRNDKMGEFIMMNKVHLQQEPEFRKIVQDFVCYILNINVAHNYNTGKTAYLCEFNGEETIDIGKVRLHIESRSNNIYINNHRIGKDDLVEIIFKAISFTDQERFDEYLKYSSGVNLALQKALNDGGVSFELTVDITDDNALATKSTKMILSMPIKREKGKNCTTIDGKDFKIQNLKAFLDIGKEIDGIRIGYGGGGYLQRTIKLLYKSIKGITPKDIGLLIKNGEKEYEKIQNRIIEENAEKSRRADEFVARAIEVSKAKKIDEGFLVTGISGKVYTVNSETRAVYEAEPDEKKRYVCIVDMSTPTDTEWGKKDALAKRLMMLAHDLKVANEVHTLGLGGDAEGGMVMA